MPRLGDSTPLGDPFALKRFKHVVRKFKTSVPRRSWRTSHKRIPLTSVERALAKTKRQNRKAALHDALEKARQQIKTIAEALHAEFQDHSVEHYLRLITQTTIAARKTRKPNRWTAYVRSEVTRVNKDRPVGDKKKVHEVVPEASANWQSMTKEEQVSLTDPLLKDIEEFREMKKLSIHNVPMAGFNDATSTLQHVEEEIRALHARTGTEVMLIAVRGDVNDYLRPLTIFSSERTPNFFRVACNMELTVFAIRLEAYCISGIDGVAKNYVQETVQMKSEVASLIAKRLDEAAGCKVRISYQDFDRAITMKHSVVLEGWPLDKFRSPSDIPTRNDIIILREAFLSNTARFRRLSTKEYEEWYQRRVEGLQGNAAAAAPPPPPATPPDHPDHPDSTLSAPVGETPPAAPVGQSIPPLNNASSSVAIPDNPPSPSTASKRPATSATSVQAPNKRARTAFVNAGITDVNGNIAFVTDRKARKKRSDAGKKRGRRQENHAPDNS